MKSKQTLTAVRKKANRIPYHFKPDFLSYEEWQIGLRRQFALEQHYRIKNMGDHPIYSDFEVLNPETEKTYKVAIRSEQIGLNFCSCPDFAINTLGTCKHIEYMFHHLGKTRKTAKLFKESYIQPYSSIFLRYGKIREVVLKIGMLNSKAIKELAVEYFDNNYILRGTAYDHFEIFIEKILQLDPQFRCYKDALDYIIEVRDSQKRKTQIDQKYPQGKESPAFSSLVKADLYDYQKEAVLFAVKTGRCIIADDMGLGKTLEAIAATELMAREFGVEKVLIICPASLKYQWKAEIEKFSNRDAFVIEGPYMRRREQYGKASFFKITTYNSIKNDLSAIEKMSPDLVILDEAQRIKNWKTKTAQSIKSVKSQYAIVLTGTPLENRLEELHSITEFIDRFCLGPLFRFLADHQILDKTGKVVGYKNLHQIAKTISPILIRRSKKEVMRELPPRIDKNHYVPMTEEQKNIHDEHYSVVSRLVNKWRRYKFLSEKERQSLMIHLNCMRMVSDSTYILDETTRYDTKITELMILLDEIFQSGGRKVVIFSQWERMTRLVSQELEKRNIGYEYLHGGVPSHKRKDLLSNFHNNIHSRVFLSTDAGSVGLNLQCASFLVNLDCPWNPAVLEQRIGRIYRHGQKNPIDVVNFISSGTIEEMIQETLKFKKSVFAGVLDNGMDEVFMGENKFGQFMKGIEKIITPEIQAQQTVQDSSAHSPTEPKSVTTAEVSLEDLFTSGLNFLEKLTQSIHHNTGNGQAGNDSSGGGSSSGSAKVRLASFVGTDEKTGNSFLKLPIPDEAVLNKAMTILDAFSKALMNRKASQ